MYTKNSMLTVYPPIPTQSRMVEGDRMGGWLPFSEFAQKAAAQSWLSLTPPCSSAPSQPSACLVLGHWSQKGGGKAGFCLLPFALTG